METATIHKPMEQCNQEELTIRVGLYLKEGIGVELARKHKERPTGEALRNLAISIQAEFINTVSKLIDIDLKGFSIKSYLWGSEKYEVSLGVPDPNIQELALRRALHFEVMKIEDKNIYLDKVRFQLRGDFSLVEYRQALKAAKPENVTVMKGRMVNGTMVFDISDKEDDAKDGVEKHVDGEEDDLDDITDRSAGDHIEITTGSEEGKSFTCEKCGGELPVGPLKLAVLSPEFMALGAVIDHQNREIVIGGDRSSLQENKTLSMNESVICSRCRVPNGIKRTYTFQDALNAINEYARRYRYRITMGFG